MKGPEVYRGPINPGLNNVGQGLAIFTEGAPKTLCLVRSFHYIWINLFLFILFSSFFAHSTHVNNVRYLYQPGLAAPTTTSSLRRPRVHARSRPRRFQPGGACVRALGHAHARVSAGSSLHPPPSRSRAAGLKRRRYELAGRPRLGAVRRSGPGCAEARRAADAPARRRPCTRAGATSRGPAA